MDTNEVQNEDDPHNQPGIIKECDWKYMYRITYGRHWRHFNFFTDSSETAIQKSDACQTNSYLTLGTPRKKKMQWKRAIQHKQLIRLKKKSAARTKKRFIHLRRVASQANSRLCWNAVKIAQIVVMACAIADKWKQPLGYFLVHESCKSSDVRIILFDAIDIGKKVIFLYDPPHLTKTARNNLLKYDFHFDGKVASWQDVKNLFEKDSSLSICCCPKLTEKHINPNLFTKMKVKLATQVLNHPVAAAISTYVSLRCHACICSLNCRAYHRTRLSFWLLKQLIYKMCSWRTALMVWFIKNFL